MRSAARRTAAVLMVALVAMLLVAAGGSSRGAQHRVSAGTGQAAATPLQGRHVDVTAPTQQDQPMHVLDLAATPPVHLVLASHSPAATIQDRATSFTGTTDVAPVGRAPPAV